jgi:phage shock protein A
MSPDPGKNKEMTDSNTHMTEEKRGLPVWIPVVCVLLGVGLIGAFAFGMYEHSNLLNLRLEMAEMQKEVKTLRQAANETDNQVLAALESVRSELDSTRKESVESVEKARAALRRQTDLVAARLAKRQEEQNKLLAEQAEQLDEIKSTAESASARLTDISTDVGEVRTEVASTRGELDKTIADLRRTTGDMGVMSGLIATNRKELEALRSLGERDYYEFTITKNQKQQRIGDIVMQVKKIDTKRNRFTVDIVADDKRVEKKDKTLNEPVQFYVLSRARVPYELVVNEVRKDTLVGYLAMPKVKLTAQR